MLKMSARGLRPLLALLLSLAACSSGSPVQSPATAAPPTDFCTNVGGTWDGSKESCSLTGTNSKNVTAKVQATYPANLLDDPAAGPALQQFLSDFFKKFGHPNDNLTQNSEASLGYKTYKHAPNTLSVVFFEEWFVTGTPHPNDAVITFTFDQANKKPLTLGDLFCPGVDPLVALPPLVRPYVEQATGLDKDPRLTISQFEPQPGHGGYSDDYKAWYLDGEDLVLVMPAERSGPVHAGAWQPRTPLSALVSIQRGGACSA
ncbi:hypothetical protein [Mycobacterium sp. NPDC050853]|uniref:hypothetical protein n=1 Tax=Mycobacterium sp. NPDC050853 TaxID=3155160 RepID=UPI00340CF3BC